MRHITNQPYLIIIFSRLSLYHLMISFGHKILSTEGVIMIMSFLYSFTNNTCSIKFKLPLFGEAVQQTFDMKCPWISIYVMIKIAPVPPFENYFTPGVSSKHTATRNIKCQGSNSHLRRKEPHMFLCQDKFTSGSAYDKKQGPLDLLAQLV